MTSLSNTTGAQRYASVSALDAMVEVDSALVEISQYGDVWLRGHTPFGESRLRWYMRVELYSKRPGFSAEYKTEHYDTPAEAAAQALRDLKATLT